MDYQVKQQKQQELNKLYIKLYGLRQQAVLAFDADDTEKLEEYNEKAYQLAQKCTALQLEVDLDE